MRDKATNLGHVREALNSIVFDTEMKKQRWGLWERARQALEFLNDSGFRPVYVILGEPGPGQLFVEMEDDAGRSIAFPQGVEEYPGHPGLWRLGPLWAFPPGEAPQPVSGKKAPPGSKTPQGNPSGDSPPVETPGSKKEKPNVSTQNPNNAHKLTIHIEGEADGTCSCGTWRLLRMSAGGTAQTPQREFVQEIREAHQQHLNKIAN